MIYKITYDIREILVIQLRSIAYDSEDANDDV